ncbi:MAG: penicillin-binding protein 2 [Lachnospiraceae bacterium]|nr:penicillin-binding protein 2 [Lachnospiraceae bacterium]
MPRRKKKLTKKQQITLKMKRKLALLFVIIIGILLGIIVRLVYINRVSGEQYTKRVLSQQDTNSTTLPYKRGDIYDRNGTVLATSEKKYNVILDPGVLWEYYDEDAEEDYVEPTLQALADCFGLDRSELDTIMEEKKDSHYVVLAKELSKDEVQEFEDLADEDGSRIAGVWMEDTYVRTYPYDSLACNVIGYTVSGDVGQYGIEQEYSSILNGENGRSYNYLNEDMEQETTVQAAVDGYSVVSTIDVTLQRIVEEAITEFQEKYTDNYREGDGSSTAAAIMMDPNTGEILAMASNRTYDLNNPYDLVANGVYTEEEAALLTEDERLEALNELWRNYCVSDTYEPGSVAKPLTIAAALETGAVYDGETFLCDGYQEVGGYTIYCSHRSGHGIIDLQGALTFSCNDALMQIASKLGTDNFSTYQNLFNLGLRTGIDLPGEARTDSLIYYSESMATSESSLIMGSTDLATNSFGQNYNVTMVQMAAAFCACINGGYYYQPHVVSKILDSDGGTIETIEPTVLREPISSKTSDIIRQYLYETIYGDDDANGNTPTGRNARIAGYSLGGKTGTAEKIPRDKTNYLVSFIGFAPADNPQVVLYVIVDEPNAEKQSSASYAIEIWKNIMEEALPYLNIPQTEEIPEDLLDEIEAEEEESTEESEETEEEEETEEGTLVDPQTGETVTMPDPETEDSDDVLGDTPVNDNLVDVEPEDALSEDEDENPTE